MFEHIDYKNIKNDFTTNMIKYLIDPCVYISKSS